MNDKNKTSDADKLSLIPAEGGCRYELGYEIGLDFERLRHLPGHDRKVRGRKGVKKC